MVWGHVPPKSRKNTSRKNTSQKFHIRRYTVVTWLVACIASVSVGFRSKVRLRNNIFYVFPLRKMGVEPKKKTRKKGEGDGKEWHACRQNPEFGKSPT